MDIIDTKATDTDSEGFNEEKFQEKFSGLLGRINDEKNYNTVTEFLIPELEKLLIPAIEAGTDVRTLKYAVLRRLRGDAKHQALTLISKIAIGTCLKNAQREGITIDLPEYGNFGVNLIEAEKRRWIRADRYEGSNICEVLESHLRNACSSTQMDPRIIIQIAQITFPDYAYVIPNIVAKMRS